MTAFRYCVQLYTRAGSEIEIVSSYNHVLLSDAKKEFSETVDYMEQGWAEGIGLKIGVRIFSRVRMKTLECWEYSNYLKRMGISDKEREAIINAV